MICTTCNTETDGAAYCSQSSASMPCPAGLPDRPARRNRAGEDYPYIAKRLAEIESERREAAAKS